jgi:N6-L-threonylcarbamoyladenine synthase
MPVFLGLDTSNYTTSAAIYNSGEDRFVSVRRLLSVPEGGTGLRQSDALFQHVKQLPEILRGLNARIGDIDAIGVSARPSGREGSYMPCFLAGLSLSYCLSALTGIPVSEFTHQQGHIASAAWSCQHPELIESEHLAWHLSGGTTELLRVLPSGTRTFAVEKIGGTQDLTAGQLIDRAGNMLGLTFPAGAELDRLSLENEDAGFYQVRVENAVFSLSGLENKAGKLFASGKSASYIAAFLLKSVCEAVSAATLQAIKRYPGLPILCSGGVSSNHMLRRVLTDRFDALFAAKEYASDNAAGAAYLAFRTSLKDHP